MLRRIGCAAHGACTAWLAWQTRALFYPLLTSAAKVGCLRDLARGGVPFPYRISILPLSAFLKLATQFTRSFCVLSSKATGMANFISAFLHGLRCMVFSI